MSWSKSSNYNNMHGATIKKLTTYLHLVLRLRMNETVALFPLHTYIAKPGTTLLYLSMVATRNLI
jgi:hypothetical protein